MLLKINPDLQDALLGSAPTPEAKAAAEAAPEWLKDACLGNNFVVVENEDWDELLLSPELYGFLTIVHR